jgi:hypothetical protein
MTQMSDEELLAALKEVDVPEPSPLFWEHLSQRVKDSIADEPLPPTGWLGRFNFAWAAGIFAVVAVAVIAVTVTVHLRPREMAVSATGPVTQSLSSSDNQPVPLAPIADDASWALMGDLASDMDLDQARAAGLIVMPGEVDRVVTEMTPEEQRAVVEFLQQEIKNSKPL